MHENFFHKLKVYYEDTDSGGVVYYANYLKFLERARTEALFSIGYSNKKIQDMFNSLIIVKSCNIDYAPEGVVSTLTPDERGAPPTIIKMNLSFGETEIMTKETIAQGF